MKVLVLWSPDFLGLDDERYWNLDKRFYFIWYDSFYESSLNSTYSK